MLRSGGLLVARKRLGEKTVEVLYKEEKSDKVVVTAYYDDSIR